MLLLKATKQVYQQILSNFFSINFLSTTLLESQNSESLPQTNKFVLFYPFHPFQSINRNHAMCVEGIISYVYYCRNFESVGITENITS